MPARALRRGAVLAASLALVVFAFSACATGPGDPNASPVAPLQTVSPNFFPSPIPQASVSLPACEYPTKRKMPDWLPQDLPLPDGTYLSQRLPRSFGYHRAIFVVPVDLNTLARFVLTQWPAAGWTLGRGDAEATEIEDSFFKAPATGAFKAQLVYCAPGYSLMLILFTPDRATIGQPSPITNGGSPIPTPS